MTGLILRLATLSMVLPALSACVVVGPDYNSPTIALPAQWSSTKANNAKPAELAEWWKRFNDPVLNELISQAVTGNNNIAIAKAKIREARASYQQASGALWPQASGNAGASRNKSRNSGESSSFRGGFDTSWELDLFGANRRGVEAARYGLDAVHEEMRATLLTLIGDVTSNYIQLRGDQARLALAQRTAASQNRTAVLTQNKFEAGAVSELDLANAQGQASSTEAVIPDIRTSIMQTTHRLAVLTGQAPTALNQSFTKVLPVPSPPPPVAKGVPADLLLNRPDLRVAERQYARATAVIGQREAERYPSVSLTGNISTSGMQLGDLGKSSTISWSFGPGLTVPIFNAGKLQAAVDGARAARDQSFIAYRAAILTALEEVENASISLTQRRIKYAKLIKAVTAYRTANRISQTLYQTGSTSFLELLTAERSLYSSEETLIQIRVALAQDYIALNKALGGGWDGAIDVSHPEVVDGYTGPHLATKQTSNAD